MSRLKDIVATGWALTNLREFRTRPARCPMCGPSIFVKLSNTAISVRCMRCGASAIHMAIAEVVATLYPNLSDLTIYEMSSRGAWYHFLAKKAGRLVFSEYYDHVTPGQYNGNVQCQNVENLTYADASFDLCTSTEVFEHVPDDRKGFREVLRVLRPGGRLIFTVPLSGMPVTIERAAVVDGEVRHLEPPEYHGDSIRGHGKVLCFRNYGHDIVERLSSSGFRSAIAMEAATVQSWDIRQEVIVAQK